MNQTTKLIFDYKLCCAHWCLEKMPEKIPLEIEVEDRKITEVLIESFLFFSISAFDIILKEINRELSLSIPDWKVTFSKIRKKLLSSKGKSLRIDSILSEFDKYFTEPWYEEKATTHENATNYAETVLNGKYGLEFWEKFENRNSNWIEHIWHREKSSLWELKQLRNEVAHGLIIKQSREQINHFAQDAIHVKLEVDDKFHNHNIHFVYNPKAYFSESFNDLDNLMKSLATILL